MVMNGGRAGSRLGFFDEPLESTVHVTTTMSGEESAPMPPEKGPQLIAISRRQWKRGEFLPAEELEMSLAMRRRNCFQASSNFEEKHQPMGLSGVAMFADETSEMKI